MEFRYKSEFLSILNQLEQVSQFFFDNCFVRKQLLNTYHMTNPSQNGIWVKF